MAAPFRQAFTIAITAGLALAVAMAVTCSTVPRGNLDDGGAASAEREVSPERAAATGPAVPVDALLVLGSPATSSGAMTPMQYARVLEAVREYQRGRAAHILFSGGAAANSFVEAHVMAEGAQQMGVPGSAVLEEGRSRTTLENIRNSLPILQAHGWRRIEVISSGEHLNRVALLLGRTQSLPGNTRFLPGNTLSLPGNTMLLWRLHAAPTPNRPWWKHAIALVSETVATSLLRWFGLRAEPVLHAVSKAFALRVFYVRVWLHHRWPQHHW